MEECWAELNNDPVGLTDQQYITRRLMRLIRGLGSDERGESESVLAEWALSDQPRKQFHALVLIDKLEITRALPTLRELASQLEVSSDPGAPYNWAWVDRIAGKLDASRQRE